jgi:hypothetical protein
LHSCVDGGETGEWRRIYNKELYNLYSSLHVIRVVKSRKIRWGGARSTYEEIRSAYRGLVVKTVGKR